MTVLQWLGMIALFAVVVAGVGVGVYDLVQKRWRRAPKAVPKTPAEIETDTQEAIVRSVLAGATSGCEVRWGSLIVTPKDRGPYLKTWRIDMEGVHAMRVVGLGDLEATVKKHIRAMRRSGRHGDETDVRSKAATAS